MSYPQPQFVDSKPPIMKHRTAYDNLNGSSNRAGQSTSASMHRQMLPPPSPSQTHRRRGSNASINLNSNSNLNLSKNNLFTDTHRTSHRASSNTSINKNNSSRPSSATGDDTLNYSFESKRDNCFLEDRDEQNEKYLKCIFTVDGKSADVELSENKITWKYISAAVEEVRSSKSKRNSLVNGHMFEINYDRIVSVEPLRGKHAQVANTFEERYSLEDNYPIEGFYIHTFQRTKPNQYQPRTICFTHPHRQTCKRWLIQLYEFVKSFRTEKRFLILLNPYAGERRTRSILNFVIIPLLKLVNCNLDIVEFDLYSNLRESIYEKDINPNNYYGIIIIAGDGSVSTVIRDLIEKQANDEDNVDLLDLNKYTFKTPFCIIPAGTTNMIATSIYGSKSYYTPIMYLLYGKCMNIDISSIYTPNHKFYNFGFGFSCGFGANVVRYANRYSRFGKKKLQASLARAASKKKQKPIEVEIKYKVSSGHPNDKVRCLRDCSVCENTIKSLESGKASDEVQEFDPLAVSIGEIEDNLGDNYRRGKNDENSQEWKTVCGTYMHIELLTNAMLWELAPEGLSKYGHVADGSMDLILVDPVPRKEFYRFIKRHTNKKNQLELPFVKAIRIKEAKIKIKNHDQIQSVGKPLSQQSNYTNKSDSYNNSYGRSKGKKMNHFSTENYDPAVESKIFSVSESNSENSDEDFISKFNSNNNNDDEEQDDNYDRTSRNFNQEFERNNTLNESFQSSNHTKRKPVMYYIEKNQDSNRGAEQNTSQIQTPDLPDPHQFSNRKSSLRKSGNYLLKKSRSIVNLFTNHDKKGDENGHSKKEKLQIADTFKTPFSWNIDWNLTSMPVLHIKCHKQFLPVFACGLDEDTEYEETVKSCFPVI